MHVILGLTEHMWEEGSCLQCKFVSANTASFWDSVTVPVVATYLELSASREKLHSKAVYKIFLYLILWKWLIFYYHFIVQFFSLQVRLVPALFECLKKHERGSWVHFTPLSTWWRSFGSACPRLCQRMGMRWQQDVWVFPSHECLMEKTSYCQTSIPRRNWFRWLEAYCWARTADCFVLRLSPNVFHNVV